MLDHTDHFLSKIFELGSQPDKTLSFLNLDDYLKIMYDFEVTPHLISKEGIITTFQKSLSKGIDFMTYD